MPGLRLLRAILIKPGPNGTDVVLGVPYDKEATIKDVERKLDVSSWNMATMFSLLNLARGLIEFGDMFLLMLGSGLLIAVRLAVPFMIAVAIDRNLAHKVAYPFAWGWSCSRSSGRWSAMSSGVSHT